MLPHLRRCRLLPPLALALAAIPAPGLAQFQDARVPESGQLWFEITPTLLNWTEQFADGDREPLWAHFGGPLPLRTFPESAALLDHLNADADALGFEAVAPEDFSYGDLDFSLMRAQVRRLALGGELGLLDWVSAGVRAPFTLTDLETRFAFDSTSATVTSRTPGLGRFLSDAGAAMGSLNALIAGGTLSGAPLAEAMRLRDDAGAFLDALQRRSSAGAMIPTTVGAAGAQMLAHYAAFVAAFDAFELELPELALPEFGTAGDYERLFAEPGFEERLPRNGENGLALGELEVFVRVNLIDQITRRHPILPPDPGARPAGDVGGSLPTAAAGAEAVPGSGARGGDQGVEEGRSGSDGERPSGKGGRPRGGADQSGAEPRGGIRFRTTVAGLLRFPIASQNGPPVRDITNSADVPLGDGQTDIEIALYQDVAIGRWFLLQAAGHYGIQQSDAYLAHVVPPDRPYTTEAPQVLLFRDLGDYVSLIVRPSLRLNSALSVGLEYDYFRLGQPAYAFPDPDLDELQGWDATLVGREGSQTRHRLGVGLAVDLSEAQGRDARRSGILPARRPFRFGLSLRRAVSGSGGRTPASFHFGADLRFPIDIF